MTMTSGNPARFIPYIFAILALAVPMVAAGAASDSGSASGSDPDSAPAMDTVSLSIEGISSTSGEDNPGILYILPWQPPTLPRRTREGLDTNASELLEPMDPVVFERHRNFQQSLNPALDSTNNLR